MSEVTDKIKTDTRKDAVNGIEEKVAVYLKRGWKMMQMAASQPPSSKDLPEDPTAHLTFPEGATEEQKEAIRNAEWMRLARQMIDERKVTVKKKDGTEVTVSISEMDAVLTEDMKQALEVSSFNKLVPTRRQVNMIADTMSKSVAKNSGTGIGFLDGLFGGASLGDVFMGLFSWVFSGFKGGFGGLKETIANRTGDRLESGVVSDLTKLQQRLKGTDDDISAFMGPDVIRQVGREVQKAPAASLQPGGKKPPGASLSDVKLGDMGTVVTDKIRGGLEEKLKTEIDAGFKKNPQLAELFKPDSMIDTAKSWVSMSDRPKKRAVLEKVRDGVAKRLSSVITDPNYRYNGDDPNLVKAKGASLKEMDTATRAAVLAYEARQTIKQLAAEDKSGQENLYALLSETLPGEVGEAIKAQDGTIRAILVGPVSGRIISVDNANLSDDPEAQRKASIELGNMLKGSMQEMFYPDGKPNAEGEKLQILAGGGKEPIAPDVMKKKLGEVVDILSPKLLEYGKREKQTALKAMQPDAALKAVADDFYIQLKDNKAKINTDGVQFSDEALRLAAMQMAATYAEKSLGYTADQMAGFKAEMKRKEEELTNGFVDGMIRPQLEANKELIESLIDPTKRKPTGEPPALKLEEGDMNKLVKALSKAVVAKGSDPNLFKGIKREDSTLTTPRKYTVDPDKYAAAYKTIADEILKELNNDTTLPFSDKAKAVMARQMAVKVVNKQAGIDDDMVPANIQEELNKDVSGVLADGLKDMLYPDGKPTDMARDLEALAGAGEPVSSETLKTKIDQLAMILTPKMLEYSAPEKKKALKEKRVGALDEITGDFLAKLEENEKAINTDGVKFDKPAMEVAARRLAVIYAKKSLGLTDEQVKAFEAKTAVMENAIRDRMIDEMVGKPLRENRDQLEALVDPKARPIKKLPNGKVEPRLTEADMKTIKDILVAEGMKAFADPKATEGIKTMKADATYDVDPTKYKALYDKLSGDLLKALNNDKTLPFSPEAKIAMSKKMAISAINSKLGLKEKDVPLLVQGDFALARIGFVRGMVATGLKEEMDKSTTKSALRAANRGVDVKTDVAISLVQDMVAAKVAEPEKLAAMSDADYNKYFDDVRAKLAANADKLGIQMQPGPVADPSSNYLLDMMAAKIVNGTTEKALETAGLRREPTSYVTQKEAVAQQRLAAKIIPSIVRESLVPKLRGTVSATDLTPERSNKTIANIIAMDAQMYGKVPNEEVIIKRVSDVMIAHQLSYEMTGRFDKEEMRKALHGALVFDDVGLGAVSAEKLASIMADEFEDNLKNPGKPALSGPQQREKDAKTAAEMVGQLKEMARKMTRDELDRNKKTKGWDSALKDDIAKYTADGVADIAEGRATRLVGPRGNVEFVDLNPRDGNERDHRMLLIIGHVEATVKSKLMERSDGWLGSGWSPESMWSWKKETASTVGTETGRSIMRDLKDVRPLRLPYSPENRSAYDRTRVAVEEMERSNVAMLAAMPVEALHAEFIADLPKAAFKDGLKVPVLFNPNYAFERDGPIDPKTNARVKDLLPSAQKYAMLEASLPAELPSGALPQYMADNIRKANEAYGEMITAREKKVAGWEALAKRNGDEFKRVSAGMDTKLALRFGKLTLDDYIKGMPADENVKAIVTAQQDMSLAKQRYDERLAELDKGLGALNAKALARLDQLKEPKTKAEFKERIRLRGIVEEYRMQKAVTENWYNLDMMRATQRIEDAALKLPEEAKAPEEVKKAALVRQAAAPTPGGMGEPAGKPAPQIPDAITEALFVMSKVKVKGKDDKDIEVSDLSEDSKGSIIALAVELRKRIKKGDADKERMEKLMADLRKMAGEKAGALPAEVKEPQKTNLGIMNAVVTNDSVLDGMILDASNMQTNLGSPLPDDWTKTIQDMAGRTTPDKALSVPQLVEALRGLV